MISRTVEFGLNAVREAALRAANGGELFEQVSSRLRRVVPFDGATWFATDPSTVLATLPVGVENIEEGHCDTFWERVFNLDCRHALATLSGDSMVRGEVFTFTPTRDGKCNVLVNGAGTSVWVDANGRIGSLSKGGPTIAQWLRWYGNDWRSIVDTIKARFPEVAS